MTEEKKIQLLKVVKETGVGVATLAEELQKHGHKVEAKPTTKIGEELYQILLKAFKKDMEVREESRKRERARNESIELKPKVQEEEIPDFGNLPTSKPKVEEVKAEPEVKEIPQEKETPKAEVKETTEKTEKEPEIVTQPEVEEDTSSGLKIVGKIDLSTLDSKKAEKGTKGKKGKEKEKEKEKEQPIAEAPAPESKTKKTKTPKAEDTPTTETPPVSETPEEVTPPPPPAEETEKPAPVTPVVPEVKKFQRVELTGPKVMGKMDLGELERIEKLDKKSDSGSDSDKKRKKKKKKVSSIISTDNPNLREQVAKGRLDQNNRPAGPGGLGQFNRRPGTGNFRRDGNNPDAPKQEITDKQVQDKLKQTLSKLQPNKGQGLGANRYKVRKQKRDQHARRAEQEMEAQEKDSKILKVTEYISANELAKMMEIPVTSIITTCFQLGMMVSINQRLDAETISILADEFGYDVSFVGADVQEAIEDEVDDPETLQHRPPIVTVMGHVDHGKTSLLDYIRKANVIAGEAGGITQHIGAYEVTLKDGRKITFLDTPGHEAFTAMRARGAQLTDIAIIVISADDAVMPQTREAISHAQAANVPMVFAINKIDKDGANPDKIREQLAGMNILVEEWGGKYQCQEISAKKGLNIDELLEKVLLEAEILDLKANPDRNAKGAIIEAKLDKGRGVVATIMVQTGTLRIGDAILAGHHFGKVKAMFNERGSRIELAGPSTPVSILGFSNAPQAGETFVVMEDEDKLKEIANKREQILREQGMRTRKHITLDEIGRRLAIGNFKELNIIVKADVDGSAEALTDSFLKLSTQEVQVNVILKGVGQISESDVNLAAASDAIIVGFQVRPSLQARKLAEADDIEIRYYSIIYDAIADVKAAMEGMLAPKIEEKVVGTIEVRQVFKISKVGTIAGCYVTDGKFTRNTKVRILRDGVVLHTGELDSLKRFKDDVKEVGYGYECGLSIKNFNDLKEGDILEGFEEVEIKRKL